MKDPNKKKSFQIWVGGDEDERLINKIKKDESEAKSIEDDLNVYKDESKAYSLS